MPIKGKPVTKYAIIIRNTPYKEKDAMISGISEEGYFSFYARGVKAITSKFAHLCQSYCYDELLLNESSSGSLTLKEGKVLDSFFINDDLEKAALQSLILEILLKAVHEEEAKEVYPYLLACLKGIKEGKEPYSLTLIFAAATLRIIGYGLDVDHCISCGSKTNINAISYVDGGFLCAKCAEEYPSAQKEDKQTLKILRYIFRAPSSDIGRVLFTKKEAAPILEEIVRLFDELTGISLKSLDLLKVK